MISIAIQLQETIKTLFTKKPANIAFSRLQALLAQLPALSTHELAQLRSELVCLTDKYGIKENQYRQLEINQNHTEII